VVLANDLRETLGTVFARQYLVGHDRKLLLYAADVSRFSQAQWRLFYSIRIIQDQITHLLLAKQETEKPAWLF